MQITPSGPLWLAVVAADRVNGLNRTKPHTSAKLNCLN